MATAAESDAGFHESRRDSDHESFLQHKGMRWLKVALVLSLAAILGYAFADVEPRPNGGTWYGYALGTIGALIILWLTWFGYRKRAYDGPSRVQAFLSAHVYLGLSLIVVATLHTGFHFGWDVHTLTYGLMLLVIVSGLRLVAAGTALGVLAAIVTTRVLATIVFDISTTDLGTFLAVPVVLMAVAGAACYIPTRRVSNIEPLKALNTEP